MSCHRRAARTAVPGAAALTRTGDRDRRLADIREVREVRRHDGKTKRQGGKIVATTLRVCQVHQSEGMRLYRPRAFIYRTINELSLLSACPVARISVFGFASSRSGCRSSRLPPSWRRSNPSIRCRPSALIRSIAGASRPAITTVEFIITACPVRPVAAVFCWIADRLLRPSIIPWPTRCGGSSSRFLPSSAAVRKPRCPEGLPFSSEYGSFAPACSAGLLPSSDRDLIPWFSALCAAGFCRAESRPRHSFTPWHRRSPAHKAPARPCPRSSWIDRRRCDSGPSQKPRGVTIEAPPRSSGARAGRSLASDQFERRPPRQPARRSCRISRAYPRASNRRAFVCRRRRQAWSGRRTDKCRP